MLKFLVLSLVAVVMTGELAFAEDGEGEDHYLPQTRWLSASGILPNTAVHGHPGIEADDKACKSGTKDDAAFGIRNPALAAAGAGVPAAYLCCRDCPGGGVAVPRAQWLSPSEVSRKLTARGYHVHEIEAKREAYEFEATDSAGARIEAYAHPATGKVLPRGVLCCAPCLGI